MRAPLAKAFGILPGLALAVAVMFAAGEVARRLGAVLLRLEGVDPAVFVGALAPALASVIGPHL
jgi:hypothetical protein